jgi:hypothetical protein
MSWIHVIVKGTWFLEKKMVPHHGHVNLQHGCPHMFIQATCKLCGIIFPMGLMFRKWPHLVNVAPPHILQT